MTEKESNLSSKILIIVGTIRQERNGRKVADWYYNQAKNLAPHLDFEIFDLQEQNLPLFNEPVPPLYHQYSELQNKLAKKIAAADGFIFVTGEYNHSVPGSLKNFLDYINAEWNHKVVAYVGYGGTGAIRSIEHLIQISTELRMANVANTSDHIHINQVWEAFDDNGQLKPTHVRGDIAKQLQELTWWVNALKTARLSGPLKN